MPFRICLAAALAAGLLLAPAATAQTTLATTTVPSKVATYGGVVAYSELDPATGMYRLMYDTNADGAAEPVPVAQRTVPFDVDLGPSRDGGVLAVYSRCQREPRVDRRSGGPHPVWTTARECDIHQYDFRAGRESLVQGPSTGATTEVLPSVWRDEIAFVRVFHRRDGNRGVYPYIYVRTLGADAPSRRQPGGARGSSGIPGPMALDLVGSRLAFSWVYEREGGGVSEARVVDVDRSHQKIDGEGWEDSVLRYLSPHVADGRVYYGEQRAMPAGGEGPATRSLASRIWRYRISTGELSRADAPAQLYAAIYDRRAFLTVYGTTGSFLDPRGCAPRCELARPADGPRFEVVRLVDADWRRCGDVVYTPQTDNGAFDIRARGVSCSTARAVARAGDGAGRNYSSRGFLCTGTVRENGLRRTVTTCRDGARRIEFVRS
jgi:hypothetical protein